MNPIADPPGSTDIRSPRRYFDSVNALAGHGAGETGRLAGVVIHFYDAGGKTGWGASL